MTDQPTYNRQPSELRPDFLREPLLDIAADILDDNEKTWIANNNRLRILTLNGMDSDGETRGFGLTMENEDVQRLAELVARQEQMTKDATSNLQRIMARHPLHEWQERQKGIGAKQFARLLATIGDPYWNTLHDRPRMVSELWAYCGMHVIPVQSSTVNHSGVDHLGHSISGNQGQSVHPIIENQTDDDHSTFDNQVRRVQSSTANQAGSDQKRPDNHTRLVTIDATNPTALSDNDQGHSEHQPPIVHSDHLMRENHMGSVTYGIAPRRKRGEKSNWSEDARKRIWLISKSIVKANGEPYRTLYDETKAKYAGRVHQLPCIRCGPKGNPAKPGTLLNPGHVDARGLRAISKAVLKDLWLEAKRLHEQSPSETKAIPSPMK